jgi:hypothetical protein
MSYSIAVYPIQIFEKTQELKLSFYEVGEFLEKEENLINFTEEQLEKIESHLKKRFYALTNKSTSRKDYENEEEPSASAMLVKNALFFNARGENGIMEISMTSSEFQSSYGLKGFFAVYDTQNDGWQI